MDDRGTGTAGIRILLCDSEEESETVAEHEYLHDLRTIKDVIMSEKKDSFRHGYIFFVLWNCCVKVVDALF